MMLRDAIIYAGKIPEDEFQFLFSRVHGYVCTEARRDPDAVCTMGEVGELFEVLYSRLNGKQAETPADGAAGISRE